ncbi:MAG: ABC transporter permease, partial [Phycisphaerae bacterium]|nr:ABC transporter permease [Gemmatimonadaceae bacterium]
SRTGLSLVVLLALIMALFLPEFMRHIGIPILPRTERVIRTFIAPLGAIKSQWIIIPLLTIFYAGELVWRERDARVNEMADATPVPEAVLFVGKFLGLGLILTAWMTLLIGGGILGQTLMGYRDIEFSLYAQQLLGLQLTNYLLFALLVLVIQVVVNNKYLGTLAALVAFGSIAFAARLGIEHHLLVYAASPGWGYSSIIGYGPDLVPWIWLKLYWTGWAILLAVGAQLLWVRSKESELRARLKLARGRFTRSTAGVAALATALVLSTGAFTFYNTNVLKTYRTAEQRVEQRVEYEKRYGKFEYATQPGLVGAKLTVDIFPTQRKARIRGHYQLVNNHAQAIDTIHVAIMAGVTTGEITFDRPARTVLIDDTLGHRIYALNTPLEPGASLKLNFEVNAAPNGFGLEGYDNSVVETGTYFKNIHWFPTIGYLPSRQITAESERRKYDLPLRRAVPSLYDTTARGIRGDAQNISIEAVVSTDERQTAIAPGTLRRSWTEGTRRFFHYVTDVPVGNEYSFFSANYGIEKGKWKNVAIEVYYSPHQKENVQSMVRGVQLALDYYTEKYGPYPYSIVRFVARRGPGVGMHADASTMDFSEGAAAIDPNGKKRGLDLMTMVVAHEVSHQWWGLQVSPAYAEGGMLLSETLANYSALKVVQKELGADQVRYMLSMWREMYEEPRSRAAPPLLQAADQFTGYRKGPFALHTLGEYIGGDSINVAMRRLVEKHGHGKPPLPTSLDLYAELKAITPDSLHGLLHDLFEKNTFWDLVAEQAFMRERAPGTWEVTLDVRATKTVVDTAGVVTNVPMDDWVEIGVYEADSAATKAAGPLYLQKHRVKSGQHSITVTVPRKPDRVAIDPRYLLLGRAMENNVKSLVPRKPGV